MTINPINQRVQRFSIVLSSAVGIVLAALVAGQLVFFGRIFPWYVQTAEMAAQLAAERKLAAETAEIIDDTTYSGDTHREVVPLSAEVKGAELLQITLLESADDTVSLHIYEDEARSKTSRFTQSMSLAPNRNLLVLRMLPGELLTVYGSSWKIKVEPVAALKPQTVFENLPIYAEWQSSGTGSFYYYGPGEYLEVQLADAAGETIAYCAAGGCYYNSDEGNGVGIYLGEYTAETIAYCAAVGCYHNSDEGNGVGTYLGEYTSDHNSYTAGQVRGIVVTVHARPGQTWRAWVQDSDYDERDAAIQQEIERQRTAQ